MGILEKIAEIEREIGRTQKNKATEYHLGQLKAKLAKYRGQLLEPSGKSGEKGEGFDVMKSGDARVAMIGFPSVGKSTLLSTLTKTESCVASYEFTTLTCIPGVIDYKGANIQLLDLPGIIEGASQGKGGEDRSLLWKGQLTLSRWCWMPSRRTSTRTFLRRSWTLWASDSIRKSQRFISNRRRQADSPSRPLVT